MLLDWPRWCKKLVLLLDTFLLSAVRNLVMLDCRICLIFSLQIFYISRHSLFRFIYSGTVVRAGPCLYTRVPCRRRSLNSAFCYMEYMFNSLHRHLQNWNIFQESPFNRQGQDFALSYFYTPQNNLTLYSVESCFAKKLITWLIVIFFRYATMNIH